MKPLSNIVAIDGPAGAGKSTVARRVAAELGYAFLDTGAMYRAATWRALHENIDLDDADALAESTEAMDLELCYERGKQTVKVDGRDVTEAIRSPEVTRVIYKLDQNPRVRAHLVELQRGEGAKGPTVAEGRDMGTVVFPAARCKIYLDASLEERARRRAREQEAKGIAVDYDTVRREMHERDEKNRTRAVSPLQQAPDARRLDTTHMTVDEVVAEIVRMARGAP